jgi:hypothetical protein
MGARELSVEVLALESGGVNGVGLAASGLGRQGHLQDVGQDELDAAVGGELGHACPAGGALLDPDSASALGFGFAPGGEHPVAECVGFGVDLPDRFLAGGEILAADHAVGIVIIDGEQDILGHGRFPSTGGLGRHVDATRHSIRASVNSDPQGNRSAHVIFRAGRCEGTIPQGCALGCRVAPHWGVWLDADLMSVSLPLTAFFVPSSIGLLPRCSLSTRSALLPGGAGGK